MDLIDWWHAHYYNSKFVHMLIIIIVSLTLPVNKAVVQWACNKQSNWPYCDIIAVIIPHSELRTRHKLELSIHSINLDSLNPGSETHSIRENDSFRKPLRKEKLPTNDESSIQKFAQYPGTRYKYSFI